MLEGWVYTLQSFEGSVRMIVLVPYDWLNGFSAMSLGELGWYEPGTWVSGYTRGLCPGKTASVTYSTSGERVRGCRNFCRYDVYGDDWALATFSRGNNPERQFPTAEEKNEVAANFDHLSQLTHAILRI
jgi:hypothetical protein